MINYKTKIFDDLFRRLQHAVFYPVKNIIAYGIGVKTRGEIQILVGNLVKPPGMQNDFANNLINGVVQT